MLSSEKEVTRTIRTGIGRSMFPHIKLRNRHTLRQGPSLNRMSRTLVSSSGWRVQPTDAILIDGGSPSSFPRSKPVRDLPATLDSGRLVSAAILASRDRRDAVSLATESGGTLTIWSSPLTTHPVASITSRSIMPHIGLPAKSGRSRHPPSPFRVLSKVLRPIRASTVLRHEGSDPR